MSKRRLVFETQTKRFYEGPEPSSLVEILRDSTDQNTMLNARISEYLMQGLIHAGIPTHFIRRLNMRETLIAQSEILPFSVKVRNRVDEEFAKAMDFDLGAILPRPVVEFHYHNQNNEIHKLSHEDVVTYQLTTTAERDAIMHLARRTSDFLTGIYWSIGYILADISIEFGRQEADHYDDLLMIADDVGPVQTQLWDVALSNETSIYQPEISEIAKRFGVQ